MKHILFAVMCLFGMAFSGTAAQACPNFNMAAAEAYRASGSQLRQRQDFRVVAGGENYIWNCPGINPQSDRGAGYFPTQPDFSFDLSGMSSLQLVISVVSQCDAALLINTGAVNWYYDDDDNGNLDPRIVLTRPSNGRIDIWIGTYDGEYCNAVLSMETFGR